MGEGLTRGKPKKRKRRREVWGRRKRKGGGGDGVELAGSFIIRAGLAWLTHVSASPEATLVAMTIPH